MKPEDDLSQGYYYCVSNHSNVGGRGSPQRSSKPIAMGRLVREYFDDWQHMTLTKKYVPDSQAQAVALVNYSIHEDRIKLDFHAIEQGGRVVYPADPSANTDMVSAWESNITRHDDVIASVTAIVNLYLGHWVTHNKDLAIQLLDFINQENPSQKQLLDKIEEHLEPFNQRRARGWYYECLIFLQKKLTFLREFLQQVGAKKEVVDSIDDDTEKTGVTSTSLRSQDHDNSRLQPHL